MALRRFPRRIFQDTLILSVPGSVDRYQTPQGVTTYTVSNVHLQNDNTTHRTAQNTEVTLRGTVWVYPPYSSPDLDYWALQEAAQAAGSVMTCTIRGKSGSVTGPYTVQIIDGLPDDEDNLHHWELGIV
jgi:hypothetical protein